MIIISYILIGLGLLFTFFLWQMWRNTEFLVKIGGEKEEDMKEEDINNAMSSCVKLIFFFYFTAAVLKIISKYF